MNDIITISGTASLAAFAVSTIRALLAIVAIFLLAQVIRGGFLMATHGGKEDAKHKAEQTIKDGVFGIVLAMVASGFIGPAVNKVTSLMSNGF